LSVRLREQSRSEGVSLFVLLLAAFVTLLARYSGREDIVLGIPITSRDRLELEPLIGPLIDTAVLRIDLAGLRSFRDVLRRARSVLAGAYAHRTLSFERLVDLLHAERALDHTPVFQVMLGWLEPESQIRSLELHGLTVSPVPVDRGTSKFDLTLLLTETEGQIVAEAEYSADLFDGASIDRLLGRFGTLLDGIGTGREARWWQLPLATAAERHQLLVEWNDTRQNYPAGRTVHGLFAAQEAETPDAVAVEFEDQQLTYRELDRRANQLAHYLRASGVGPDVRVAVAVERSLEMVVALLGVLKAGGAYLPLDPTWPRKHLAFMLEDSAATVLLTQRRAPPCGLPTAGSAGMPVVRVDADWSEIARASDAPPADLATPGSLAYVMYTSGSTGVPKGVCVPHRAVVRLVRNTSYARLAADEVFLQLAPLPFDASSFEVWGSLLNGARLAVYPVEPPTVDGLLRAVHRHQVTILWLTAAFFHQVVDHAPGGLGPVRQVLAGGDVLSAPHVRRVLREWKGVRLV
ncbi:MAG: non-ribosomal peptide synthetase, partial [Candidatus Rokuibacteriota bacterium]